MGIRRAQDHRRHCSKQANNKRDISIEECNDKIDLFSTISPAVTEKMPQTASRIMEKWKKNFSSSEKYDYNYAAQLSIKKFEFWI